MANIELILTPASPTGSIVFNLGTPGPQGIPGIQGIQGIQGPKGDTGDSGVVYATAPLSYNAGTKTISIDLSPYLTSATAASTYQTVVGMSSYATLASPTFTGNPKSPTPLTADNDTSIATTAYVKSQAYLTDAPNDGTPYVRLDGAWEQLIIT